MPGRPGRPYRGAVQQSPWPAPPGVPVNGVAVPRSGPARWVNLAVAVASLLATVAVVVKVVTWDSGTESDQEVRSIVGLALAVLVLFAVIQAVFDLVAVGLLVARNRAGFVLHLLASALAALPMAIGVPIRWWWPALVAPVGFVVAVVGLGSDELHARPR